MAKALIALGTNLPHAGLAGPALLRAALARIGARFAVLEVSSFWKTAPWPPSDQNTFTNGAAAVEVGELAPEAVFAALADVERAFGRERRARWGPRTLDLDLLDLEGFAGQFGPITLPHPRLHERAFVLAPLAEIAPRWRHPVLGGEAVALLAALPEGQAVRRLADP